MRIRVAGWAWAAVAVAAMAACGGQGDGDGPADEIVPASAAPATPAPSTGGPSTAAPEVRLRCEVGELPVRREPGEPAEPALRLELVEMRDADQADRNPADDQARTDRLREIIDEYGWPTPDLVGEDGASSAWLIAQHSDFDVEFQAEVLDLMCAAVAAGDADPTEMAYLEDRVAVNSGELQIYGTQVGDGCEDGLAVPRPIADEDRVHERRAHVGLQPLEDYLAIFHC